MACITCGDLVDGAGMCVGNCRSYGGNDGIHNNAPKKKNDTCWVATAYYDNSTHEQVQLLRSYRRHLIENTVIGPCVTKINRIYHRIGSSKFGQWWAKCTVPDKKFSLIRVVSYFLLFPIIVVAKKWRN